jgi:hypothetical protein
MTEIFQFIDKVQPAVLFITGLLAIGLCWALDRMSD